jgi:hypothetical protein
LIDREKGFEAVRQSKTIPFQLRCTSHPGDALERRGTFIEQ